MDAAASYDPKVEARGSSRILEHCSSLPELDDARPKPADRLSGAVGGDLAKFLLAALHRSRCAPHASA